MSDRKAFETAVSLAPAAPRPSARLAGVAMTDRPALGSEAHREQVRAIRMSAKSPREAARQISEYTNSLKGVVA
jgi:hypothetical protein